jgi:hypothetical protein
MAYTFTTSKKWFGIFGRMLFAVALLAGGTCLLYWNERLCVAEWRTIEEARVVAAGSSAELMDLSSMNDGNGAMTWALRVVGVLLVFAALKKFMLPLFALSDATPLLGAIARAETGSVAFILGLAWSIVTIAAAWLSLSPVFSGALMSLSAALIGIVYERVRKKKARA